MISQGFKKSSGIHTVELFIGLSLFFVLPKLTKFLEIINQYLIKGCKNLQRQSQNV